MSEADMLLNNLSEGNESGSEPHFVVNPDRTITVPESLKKIAIQHDHNVETVTFDCFRFWDDHDLSQMQVYINYMRADKSVGSAMAKVIGTTPTAMTFEWTVSRSVTYFNGPLVFLVCMIQTDSEGNELYHWNSEINTDLFVGEGLEVDGETIEEYSDIITGLLTRMNELETIGLSHLVNVEEIENGYRITLTDSTGSKTIDIYHGAVSDGSVVTEKVAELQARIDSIENSLGSPTYITLTPEGWDENNQQTVSVTNVTILTNLVISLSQSSTAEEISACGESMVRCTAQGDDTVTFTALSGVAPTIPLYMTALIVGGNTGLDASDYAFRPIQ